MKRSDDPTVNQLTDGCVVSFFFVVALPTVAVVAGLSWRLFVFVAGIG